MARRNGDEFDWLEQPAARQRFARRLMAWFRRDARELPWRRTRDPYAIWVSEIMLQQTQVATVIPYYERFLRRFPTITELAAADESEVLWHWEGLGYYRRARQLHQAASRIVEIHDGQFPRDIEEVLALPGIGRYTAGAILSNAWDERQPILEANTIRLWSRLIGYSGDPRRAAGQRALWAAAGAALPRRDVGVFNQALMELGSLICQPRAPRCDECPVAEFCQARRLGRQRDIPPRASKPPAEHVSEAAIVVRRGSRVLMVLRGAGERWAGMWDFPRFTQFNGSADDEGHAARDDVRAAARHARLRGQLHSLTGVRATRFRHITTFRHTVTRFRITLDCYETQALASPRGTSSASRRWVETSQLDDLALHVTARRLARRIAETSLERGG